MVNSASLRILTEKQTNLFRHAKITIWESHDHSSLPTIFAVFINQMVTGTVLIHTSDGMAFLFYFHQYLQIKR